MSSDEIKNLRRKLKKARDSGKLQEISDCCCNLAAYLSDDEEHEEALKLYKESLTCCEKLGNKQGAALANRMIAEECTSLGYFEEALEFVSVFLKYAQDEGDKVEEQRGFVLKGHVYFTQAEYLMDTKPEDSKTVEKLLEQSMECYRKSFSICTNELDGINEREKLQMKARLLQNKSLVLSRQNKLDYAQAHLIRAIKICAKEKLNDTEHICYLSLGDLFLKKGEPDKALNVYDKALELSHSTQKKRDSLVGKSKCYIEMENYQQAKATLKKAYKIKPDDEIKKLFKNVTTVIRLESSLCSTPDTEVIVRKNLYKKLGDMYSLLKNSKKAIKCYLNMLSCAQKGVVSKKDLIKCYSALCKAFVHDKQYDKALFYTHQELESISKWAPEKASKIYLRIAKLHELNGSEFEEIHLAYLKAKSNANSPKVEKKCLKKLIALGKTFDKPDLVKDSEFELIKLKSKEVESDSSCDSGNDNESDISTDSEKSEKSSDEDLISDSDVENEEYDRPKERCKRTKFKIRRNEKGETDLHVAAIKGNYKKVKQLIEQGHPVNLRDTAGWTPLHEACNHGYVDIVNLLLDFGANINDKGGPSCDGTTPLHDAAINGQLQVIQSLIQRGASTLVLNDAGETPLQCLLAWEKNSALDADEDAIFQSIVNSLKSPLDIEDIKQHIKSHRNPIPQKPEEPKQKKTQPPEFKLTKKPSPITEYRETIDFLRGKRQSGHRSSADSDEDENTTSRKKMKSACEEYKSAIDELRFKPKKPVAKIKSKSKPALIREEEYIDNCIMENDEDIDERIEKKRKRANQKMEEPSFENCISEDDEDFVERIEKNQKKVNQKIEEPVAVVEKKERMSLEEFLDSFEVPEDVESAEDSTTYITVKIFNEKIKIPITDFSLKVNWLIQELSKKHSTLQNPDNYVTLKTQNGPIEESEPLTSILSSEVECIVTKWKALPLCERYEKVCTITSHPDVSSEVRAFGFKHNVHPQVVEIFKKSTKTRSLTLSNLKLSSLTLIPICKAIKYETFIQSLDLSNNYFGDKGIELIVKILEKSIIEELNVSGCNITSTGVYYLSHSLIGINELSRNGLEVLNISNNPITDDAIAAVESIIEQLANLRLLNVDRCDFETKISTGTSNGLVVVQGNKFESPRRNDS